MGFKDLFHRRKARADPQDSTSGSVYRAYEEDRGSMENNKNEKNQVVELECGRLPIDMTPPDRTLDDYRADYSYHLAVKLLDELRENGDITDKEYAKCELHFREKYAPFLAEIMPEIR